MRHTLRATLAVLAMTPVAACSRTQEQMTAVESEALITSAPTWTASELTRGLAVDEATRQSIEAGLEEIHASLLTLHTRLEQANSLDGDARAAALDALHADMVVLHGKHREKWEALDPAVRDTLRARLHEQMKQHEDSGVMKSLHERMRRLHDGGH